MESKFSQQLQRHSSDPLRVAEQCLRESGSAMNFKKIQACAKVGGDGVAKLSWEFQ